MGAEAVQAASSPRLRPVAAPGTSRSPPQGSRASVREGSGTGDPTGRAFSSEDEVIIGSMCTEIAKTLVERSYEAAFQAALRHEESPSHSSPVDEADADAVGDDSEPASDRPSSSAGGAVPSQLTQDSSADFHPGSSSGAAGARAASPTLSQMPVAGAHSEASRKRSRKANDARPSSVEDKHSDGDVTSPAAATSKTVRVVSPDPSASLGPPHTPTRKSKRLQQQRSSHEYAVESPLRASSRRRSSAGSSTRSDRDRGSILWMYTQVLAALMYWHCLVLVAAGYHERHRVMSCIHPCRTLA